MRTELLQEWQKHIADTHEERRGFAWCGEPLAGGEWVFQGIDHAALSNLAGSRLLPCPECAFEAAQALLGAADLEARVDESGFHIVAHMHHKR